MLWNSPVFFRCMKKNIRVGKENNVNMNVNKKFKIHKSDIIL